MLYGRDWKKVQALLKTRNIVQIRTHAQKVFKKCSLNKTPTAGAMDTGANMKFLEVSFNALVYYAYACFYNFMGISCCRK